MVVAKSWIVTSRPEGQAALSNFALKEIEVPEPQAGEFGIENLCIAVSPASVVWLNSANPGDVMRGTAIGRVRDSRHPGFKDGDLVQGPLGWTEYLISDGAKKTPVEKLNAPAGETITWRLHALGATGVTAYIALFDMGRPRVGDTVLVSAAAGSVGSIVCQLAKRAGCTVIGIAGSAQKCAWLKETIGIDHAIDYKSEEVPARLDALCPQGIDVYFDNVGGKTLEAAIDRLRLGARVVLCGATSQYDGQASWQGPSNYFSMVPKQAEMRGFHIMHYAARMEETRTRLRPLIASGALKVNEEILSGIEEAPNALIRVLSGANFGSQVVAVRPTDKV